MKAIKKALYILWFYFNWFAIILAFYVLFGFGCNKGRLQLKLSDLIFPAIITLGWASWQLWVSLTKDRRMRERAHHLDGEPEPL